MMIALATTDRDKLLKFLRLLSSDHAGEAAAAGWAACRLLRDRGLDWDAILVGREQAVLHRNAWTPRQPADWFVPAWREKAAACLARRDVLNEWELKFLSGLARFRRLSLKQSACLERIAERVLGQAA